MIACVLTKLQSRAAPGAPQLDFQGCFSERLVVVAGHAKRPAVQDSHRGSGGEGMECVGGGGKEDHPDGVCWLGSTVWFPILLPTSTLFDSISPSIVRPRADYPCPWGGAGSPSYTTDPTMAELEDHTAEGLEWVSAHRGAAEANTMLLSAWNEHDEGHW